MSSNNKATAATVPARAWAPPATPPPPFAPPRLATLAVHAKVTSEELQKDVEALPEGVVESDGESVCEPVTLGVADAVRDSVGDLVALPLRVPLLDAVREEDCDIVCVFDGSWEAEPVGVELDVGLDTCERDWVALMLPDSLGVVLWLELHDALGLPVRLRVAVVDGVRVVLRVCVWLGLLVRL